MAGDAALKLLIDIQARDSARGVIMALAGAFPLLIGSFRMLGTAASLFASGSIKAGFVALKYSILGVGVALLQILALFTLVAGVIAIAIGFKAIKAAADFQQGLNRLVTGAGDVTDNMVKMGQAILGVSVATGVLTGPLLDAMYHILSVGERGSQAMDTLKAASEGAQIEMAKVADVANILVILQTNFGLHTFTATQYMNGLIVAVAHGNITLENLSTAMAPILPLAHQLGISFMDVASAMAVQTNAGLDARKSATGLQAIFVAMENPTHKAEMAMRALGVNSVAVAEEMKKSLPGAFQMLIDAALKVGPIGSVAFNRAMMDMIGGGTRTAKSITALSQNMKAWIADIKAMSAAMHLSTKDVMGWDVAQSGFNVHLSQANAAFQALLIVIGTRLLPILSQFLGWVTPLITAFTQWVVKTDPLGKAMAWLATAFDKVKTAAITVWNFLVPIAKIIGDWLMPYVRGLGNAITTVLVPAWNQFATAIKPYVPMLLDLAKVLGIILVAAIIIVGIVILGLLLILALLVAAFLWLVTTSIHVAAWLHDTWNNVTKAIAGFFVWLAGQLAVIWDQIKLAALRLVAGILYVFSLIPGPLGDMAKNSLKTVNDMIAGIVASIAAGVPKVQNNMQMMRLQSEHQMQLLKQNLVGRSIIPDMVTQIGTAFSKLPGLGSKWFTDLKKTIMDIINTLPDLLYKAGLHMIQQLADGITAGIAAAVKAATAVANAVKKVLGHSTPEQGPLHGDDLWGLHFAQNFASGILAGYPQIQAALARLLAALSMVESSHTSGSYSLSGSSFAGGRYPSGGGGIVINHITVLPPSITLDGAEVTDKIMRRVAKEYRRTGPVKNL